MAKGAVKYKMLVIGGSAGSLNIILNIIKALPATGHLSVIIIVHRKSDSDSILTNLVAARTQLAVKEVEDKEEINPDVIYIAPPNYHLLIENERMFSLDASEKVHYSRPSIDVCFQSVAEVFGASAIGVLLSGANADGAAGLNMIKQEGGFTIVLDPLTAEVDFMPQQALDQMQPDKILSGDDMPAYIRQLVQ
jgi:two-component system chemotaxis response regulator CheB